MNLPRVGQERVVLSITIACLGGIKSRDCVEVMLLLHNLVQVLVSEKKCSPAELALFSVARPLLVGSRAGLTESNELVQRP